MAELDPDQEAALRRLRAAFGFVEVLEVVGHEADSDEDVDEAVEDSIVDSEKRGDESVVIGDARAPGGTPLLLVEPLELPWNPTWDRQPCCGGRGLDDGLLCSDLDQSPPAAR